MFVSLSVQYTVVNSISREMALINIDYRCKSRTNVGDL